MNEFGVNLPTTDGQMECFIVQPDGGQPAPPVIIYMDVLGIREELFDFARRLASQGYFAILPDMFYRAGKIRFDPATDGIEKMFDVGRALTVDMVMTDTEAMLDYLKGNDDVGNKIGCMGYCMSGQFVVAAAGNFPDEFGAAASLYGTRIVTDSPDSPHLLADKIQAEVYLGWASEDPFVEANVIPDLSKAFDDNGVKYTSVTHPDTQHGYSFPQRPIYDETASEQDWTAIFSMFERQLKQ
jgi:carboxymethylenebutenolidase